MKKVINLFVAAFLLSVLPFAKADTKRFYAGNILRAELMPCDGSDITIKNVSEYEPKLNIANPGYALITVALDQDRTISIFDYFLVYGADEFPCVALMTPTGSFDKETWEYTKTRPDKKYTMLFKVPMPPKGKSPYYSLRFRLAPPGKVNDVQLQLMDAEDGFTPIKTIPLNGMIGNKPIPSLKGKHSKKRKSKKKHRKSAGKRKSSKKAADSDEEGAVADQDSPRELNKGELEPPKKIDPKLRKKNDLDAWRKFAK